MKEYKCQECGTAIMGASQLCVSCFRKHHIACPKCMRQWGKGQWHVTRKARNGPPINCSYCNNERWLIAR